MGGPLDGRTRRVREPYPMEYANGRYRLMGSRAGRQAFYIFAQVDDVERRLRGLPAYSAVRWPLWPGPEDAAGRRRDEWFLWTVRDRNRRGAEGDDR